eukprot:6174509-Pleurochrysis_carterae.AAC.4
MHARFIPSAINVHQSSRQQSTFINHLTPAWQRVGSQVASNDVRGVILAVARKASARKCYGGPTPPQ